MSLAVNRLNRLWTSRLGDRAVVQVQNPIGLAAEDPEVPIAFPDLTIDLVDVLG